MRSRYVNALFPAFSIVYVIRSYLIITSDDCDVRKSDLKSNTEIKYIAARIEQMLWDGEIIWDSHGAECRWLHPISLSCFVPGKTLLTVTPWPWQSWALKPSSPKQRICWIHQRLPHCIFGFRRDKKFSSLSLYFRPGSHENQSEGSGELSSFPEDLPDGKKFWSHNF